MRFSLPLNLNELGKLARFDVRIYGVAEQRREAWMGGACDLLPIPRAEPPHIQSTPDPPFPGHYLAGDVQVWACRVKHYPQADRGQYNIQNQFLLVKQKVL